jgi:hypothetical protein
MDEETKLRASLAGARLARDEAQEERDRLREVLAGIVFYLGPVSSPRSGRDPADGDGVIAYSYVPALVAAAVEERDRLRAAVDAAMLLWYATYPTGPASASFIEARRAFEEAAAQLDGSADIGGGTPAPRPGHKDRDDPSYCETCGGSCREES